MLRRSHASAASVWCCQSEKLKLLIMDVRKCAGTGRVWFLWRLLRSRYHAYANSFDVKKIDLKGEISRTGFLPVVFACLLRGHISVLWLLVTGAAVGRRAQLPGMRAVVFSGRFPTASGPAFRLRAPVRLAVFMELA